jgi:hypothetical protein
VSSGLSAASSLASSALVFASGMLYEQTKNSQLFFCSSLVTKKKKKKVIGIGNVTVFSYWIAGIEPWLNQTR